MIDGRYPHSEFLAWSASDRDKAIWHHLRKRRTHGPCGTRPEEWDEDQGGHRRAYVPRILECEGCIILERTREAPELSSGRGMYVALVSNPDLR